MARVRLQDAPATTELKDNESPHQVINRVDAPHQVINRVDVSRAPAAGETISATWGEELYTPKQFNSFRVGPFIRSTTIRQGETVDQASNRIMRELEAIAAREREIKMRVFLESLAKMMQAAKG